MPEDLASEVLGNVGQHDDAGAESRRVAECEMGGVDPVQEALTLSGKDGEDPEMELIHRPVLQQGVA
jgi:hypothetical protein